MKDLNVYVNEKLNVGKLDIYKPKYFPTTNEELRKIIEDRIKKEGRNINLNDIDTSKITDMSGIFKDINFNGDISRWDVSNVTNMSKMFYNTNKLININISEWDVKNVENISFMFKNCSTLSKIQLPKFNNDNLKNTVGTFENCKSLVSVDLNDTTLENVEKCQYMFSDCTNLIRIRGIEDVNISTALSKNMYEEMFSNCPKLHIDISSWFAGGAKSSNINHNSKFVKVG